MQPYNPDHDHMVSQTEDDSRDDIGFAIFDMVIHAKTSRYTREMNKPIQSTWFERITANWKQCGYCGLPIIAGETCRDNTGELCEGEKDFADYYYAQQQHEQELAEQDNQLAREWHEKGWM